MSSQEAVGAGKRLIDELARILRGLSDHEVNELLGEGSLDSLLKAILDPAERTNYPNLNEFLLANKTRSTIVAQLHYAIVRNYALKGITKDNKSGFISPSHIQWFDDGVMFLQGNKRFEGFLGLYRQNGKLSYAILARDAREGEEMGPEYFEFIDEDEFRERWNQFSHRNIAKLDEPLRKLESLIGDRHNAESHYQELLIEHPWVLGAEYRAIQRHTKLDDRNIPDFTAVRVVDGCRDIIEVKPPFMQLFRNNGGLNSDFNDAWNQAERYLDFARTEKSYLEGKGLRFDNPKCYLIAGLDLSEDELRRIRRKERMNPAIRIRTYNDLLVFMKATIAFIRQRMAEASEVPVEATAEEGTYE